MADLQFTNASEIGSLWMQVLPSEAEAQTLEIEADSGNVRDGREFSLTRGELGRNRLRTDPSSQRECRLRETVLVRADEIPFAIPCGLISPTDWCS